VIPAWPFVIYYLTVRIGPLGERTLLAQSGRSSSTRSSLFLTFRNGIWRDDYRPSSRCRIMGNIPPALSVSTSNEVSIAAATWRHARPQHDVFEFGQCHAALS